MNLLEYIDKGLLWIGSRLGKQTAVRSYAAARQSRLTADWLTATTTMDADLRNDLASLRARARDLAQNDAYARRYLSLVRMNVPGPNGFMLQVRSFDMVRQKNEATGQIAPKKVFDEFANNSIEEAFYDWSLRQHCTVTGTMSFRDVQHLIFETVPRDGEILIRKVRGKQFKYSFALQVIEPDLLDEQLSQILPGNRAIRLGVEYDEWRKPVAYHLKRFDVRTEALSDTYDTTGQHIRVPATEIFHLYRPERAFQSRGASWMAPGMFALRMLTGYEEAALVNARASAAKMGFLKNRANEVGVVTGEEKDEEGNILQNAEPGEIRYIGDLEMQQYDPKYPDAQHAPFVKAILRRFASATGCSYNLLANDLEGVNYSSIRAGLLDEREQWKDLQSWFIEAFLEPLFAEWLEMYLLSSFTSLPVSRFNKFNAPVFVGRRWAWVDPKNDIEAALITVQSGFKSARRIMAEEGTDIAETYREMEEDKALAEEHGLDLTVNRSTPAPQAPPPAPDPEEENSLRKKRNGTPHSS
jgi:lambda family phage portal protein